MSRIANNPVNIPSGVDVKLDANLLAIKGAKGSLELPIHKLVNINFEENVFTFSVCIASVNALASLTFDSLGISLRTAKPIDWLIGRYFFKSA